jgi:hypothetical protein
MTKNEYRNLHRWVQQEKGKPTKCSKCGKIGNRIGWANVGHTYERNLDDYIALCFSCHLKMDGYSDERREKISLAKKGKPSWNKGTAGKGIMKPNITSFKPGHTPPEHRDGCLCFRCKKRTAKKSLVLLAN